MLTPSRAFAFAALCATSLCSLARADVPRTIAFQGTLKDAAGTLLTGSLGSVTPLSLPFDKPYWVGIKVGDDAEMAPRVPLTSAPDALALPTVSVSEAGKVGIGTSVPTANFSIVSEAATRLGMQGLV
jgi:hypothetical protein